MEIEFYGANCFKIKTKQTTIVIDDTLQSMGKKSITNDKTSLFYTQLRLADENAVKNARLLIESAGEFEVGDVTVTGVQTRAHIDEEGQRTATVFQFMYNNQTVTVMGHIHPDIATDVAELVSGTDVLIIPVGGNGFTLDSAGAASIIKKVEPGIIIPSYYADESLKFEIPAAPITEFGKVVPLPVDEPKDSYKLTQTVDDAGSKSPVVVLVAK